MAENLASLPLSSDLKDSSRHPGTTQPSHNSVYYFKDGVIFLVGDELFKVPRFMLELNSPVFSDMFSLPTGKDAAHEQGASNLDPIRLPEQVTSISFERLLALLYPLTTEYETFMGDWGYDEWISILELAVMWDMTEILPQAIEKLTAINRFPSPVVQLQQGRKYGYPKWIRAGISTLVTREKPLSELDGVGLGIKDTVRCAAAREEYIRTTRYHMMTTAELDKLLDKSFGGDIPKVT